MGSIVALQQRTAICNCIDDVLNLFTFGNIQDAVTGTCGPELLQHITPWCGKRLSEALQLQTWPSQFAAQQLSPPDQWVLYTTRRMQSRWEQCGNKAERNKVKRNANKKTWRDAAPSLADKLDFVAWDLQGPANAARAARFEANNAQPVIPAAAAAAAANAESGTEQTGDDEARHPDAAALGPAHVPLTHAHMLHKDLTAVQNTLRSCQQASHAAAVASAAQVYDAQHAAANSASELAKQQQAVAQLRDNLAAERSTQRSWQQM